MVRVYQVGGSVRDDLLGIKSKDVDYVVEGVSSYQEMLRYVEAQGHKVVLEEPQYSRLRVLYNKEYVDFALCKRGGQYSNPDERPDSVQPCSIEENLSFRDYTVNAIAIDVETGKHIDPYGGILDVKNKTLRAVGEPFDRFTEDPIRILRAIRFAITKNFCITGKLETEIKTWASLLLEASPERIRVELDKSFRADTKLALWYVYQYGLDAYCFNTFSNLWLKPTLEYK